MTDTLISLLPADIHLDPLQARKTCTGIKRMAESIKTRGLLEPIGVRVAAGRYVLRFGERRTRAIWHLVEIGEWPALKPVPAILREGSDLDAELDGLAENSGREDVAIWQEGAKFNAVIAKSDCNQNAIAAQIGKSVTYVSAACRIAKGLHPVVVERLNRMLPEHPPRPALVAMAERIDPETLEPDLERQTKLLESYLVTKNGFAPARARTGISQKKTVYKRFKALKDNRPKIPEHAEEYFEAMMNYLSGVTRKLSWPKEDL